MGEIKQINIKSRTYYFYNEIIDLKIFNAGLLKINKKSYKNSGYVTIKKLIIVRILKKKVWINIWFLTLQIKIKSYWKNTIMCYMGLGQNQRNK